MTIFSGTHVVAILRRFWKNIRRPVGPMTPMANRIGAGFAPQPLADEISSSFSSRIAHSAIGLVRDVTSIKSARSTTSDLASSLRQSDKEQPSASSSFAGPSTWTQLTRSRNAESYNGSSVAEVFRTPREDDGIMNTTGSELEGPAVDSFHEVYQHETAMLNGSSPGDQLGSGFCHQDNIATLFEMAKNHVAYLEDSIKKLHGIVEGKGKFNGLSNSGQVRKTSSAWITDFKTQNAKETPLPLTAVTSPTRSLSTGASECVDAGIYNPYTQQDGAEVVALLSAPNFMTELEMCPAEIENKDDVSAEDLFKIPMTSLERKAADGIKSLLPSPPEHGSIAPTNPFSLQSVLDDYIDIQEDFHSYVDEVWGEPFLHLDTAERQTYRIRQEGGRIVSQASRRLHMILDHIRTLEAQKPLSSMETWQHAKADAKELQDMFLRMIPYVNDIVDSLVAECRLVAQESESRQARQVATSRNFPPEPTIGYDDNREGNNVLTRKGL